MNTRCLLLLIALVCLQNAYGQQNTKQISIPVSFTLETDSVFDKLIKIRRDLHENPELAGKELGTQKIIQQYLLNLGLEVETSIYNNSIVGILKGKKKGKKIAWRCEMDALPNNFPDEVDFKSKIKGVQHGCGHDVHVAIALGIAEVLAKNKQSLSGTVYFIFQPEEETFVGAKAMINNGLFTKIHPDEIYALHITALPVGQIMVKSNEVFAYQKRIRITFKNELASDQAALLAKNIYKRLSRSKNGSKPWEIQEISNSKIGLANPKTMFNDYLIMDENFANRVENNERVLEANLYETNYSNLKNIIPAVKQILAESGYANQLLTISYVQANPTVMNDKKLTAIAIKTLNNGYGKDFVVADYGQVPFFNDDFAYFQQKIPGVYFLLGGSNVAKGIIALNHAPNFKVDEDCIKTGVNSFSYLIFERLKTK